ncbi:hypothetical protein SmJEL517_g05764 [Synchytrium microbalum]|uniref:BolA protein n=1 Tax=Synchytrium microbalum TaxID=1806994 RepID=A0A507BU28_9FUNG|nr:uncharacterized protein SmJEL517_g05764 [Synchytrium microbalum]TPX30741.1 hypothetical protein SmJEL517_g05764 [Synchytrium microbalum]
MSSNSGISSEVLTQAIKEKLSAEHVIANQLILSLLEQEVTDTSGGCGQSFEAIIVSSLFEGKPLLARHRLVNEACAEQIAQIHAFSQKTLTPAQWVETQSKSSS